MLQTSFFWTFEYLVWCRLRWRRGTLWEACRELGTEREMERPFSRPTEPLRRTRTGRTAAAPPSSPSSLMSSCSSHFQFPSGDVSRWVILLVVENQTRERDVGGAVARDHVAGGPRIRAGGHFQARPPPVRRSQGRYWFFYFIFWK